LVIYDFKNIGQNLTAFAHSDEKKNYLDIFVFSFSSPMGQNNIKFGLKLLKLVDLLNTTQKLTLWANI
jgi:hypothetical protein